MELARYGYTDRCIGCRHARLGLKLAGHSEERRARIVRHITSDDDLSQSVQIAQDRIVETAPPEARTGERDSVPEPARKKVRFAERVAEQTPEGTVVTNSRSTSSNSSSSSSSDSSSSPTAIATSMQVDESNQDSSKRQTVTHGADMELEGLVMESERDRLQRYSDCDFLMQVKQNADVYLDRIVSDRSQGERNVKKELIQLGVHPSVHVAEVFSSPRNARLVHRFGLTPELAFDLQTGWDLNDPAQRAKWSHLQHERPILMGAGWELEWTQCQDVTHEVDDGHIPLKQVAQGRFFCGWECELSGGVPFRSFFPRFFFSFFPFFIRIPSILASFTFLFHFSIFPIFFSFFFHFSFFFIFSVFPFFIFHFVQFFIFPVFFTFFFRFFSFLFFHFPARPPVPPPPPSSLGSPPSLKHRFFPQKS